MTVDGPPRVALGMPLRNSSRYLDEALEAMRAQTYDRFVLVLTDDDSTDGTRTIAERWCARDERFVVVRTRRASALSATGVASSSVRL